MKKKVSFAKFLLQFVHRQRKNIDLRNRFPGTKNRVKLYTINQVDYRQYSHFDNMHTLRKGSLVFQIRGRTKFFMIFVVL